MRANTPINKISGNLASKVLFSKSTPRASPRANLLDIKKRFPSESSTNKNSKEIVSNQETGRIEDDIFNLFYYTFETFLGSITSQMKNKLKIQNTSTILAKKGPMKAVIPLGNMQKQGIVERIKFQDLNKKQIPFCIFAYSVYLNLNSLIYQKRACGFLIKKSRNLTSLFYMKFYNLFFDSLPILFFIFLFHNN